MLEALKPLTTAFGFSSSALGLDVGGRSVKFVKLKKARGGVALDDIFMIDLARTPEGSGLAAAAEVHGLIHQWAFIAGSSSDVQALDLRLPKMPRKDLDLVIQKNLTDFLQCPLDDLTYDFTVMPMGTQQQVRVYYANKEAAKRVLSEVTMAKIKPKLLNTSQLATVDCLLFNGYIQQGKSYLHVEVGESATNTSLIYGSEVVASRTSLNGFGSINNALMEATGKGYLETEEMKMLQEDANAKIAGPLETAYMKILEDIQSNIDVLKEVEGLPPISEIFLSGGGVTTGPASHMLAEHNNIPTVIVNPFRKIQVLSTKSNVAAKPEYFAELAPLFCTSVGLALGGLQW